jgi:lysophospholipase L1-like esterase
MAERRIRDLKGLQQAFDEVEFGASRTLNLRASLPTASEAARRLEAWLRQHQAQQSGSVLIITGRGNNSEGGVSVVRETSIRVFHELRRKGVISDFTEHTAGSFVVTLASMAAALAAGARREQTPIPPVASPPTLADLDDETRKLLRALAEHSLDALGMREREPFLENEMLRLFGTIAATLEDGPEREKRLRIAIAAAMSEYD